MLTLTDADNGRRIPVHVGDLIELALAENATTGFRWSLERHDDHLLELTDSSADYANRATGSGGRALFRFRVRDTGSTELAARYWRQWEGPQSAIQHFSITLDSSA